MREKEIIKLTDKPNTVSSIMKDLRKLGVRKGDILLVHSSLSMLGWVCGGPQAVTADHPLTPQLGMDSPLGKLYQGGGKVLFLGTEFDTCTGFHLAEALIPEMVRKKSGTAVMEEGRRTWKEFEDFTYDSGDFGQLGQDFEKTHPVQRGKVGNAECLLFDLKEGVDFAKVWLEENRDGGQVRNQK